MELFRWALSPWAGMRQFRTDMEDAFSKFSRFIDLESHVPPVSVSEDDDCVTVVVEAPGVASDDLSIETEGDSLRLTVKRNAPEGVKSEQYHRRERSTGEFVRELKLPAGLDYEKIDAKLSNGILKIGLPKAEAAKPRTIEVKAS